jgi:nicotinamide-nucleotide amidase
VRRHCGDGLVCAFAQPPVEEFHPTPKINENTIAQNLILSIGLKVSIILLVMEKIIKKIHKLLVVKQKTVSVAESCTGGLLSKLLTQISGSSRYFLLGIIAYSNRSKESVLKIPPSLIKEKGAVSKEVALLMAKRIRALAKTDFGIGITGIAGPTGGTSAKPPGTVFIAVAGKNKNFCKKFYFSGNRQSIRKKSALKALELLAYLMTNVKILPQSGIPLDF